MTNLPVTPPETSVEDQVLVSVSKALRQAHLLSRPDQCYAYRFDPAPGQTAYSVDVRENHSHRECGGDPQTQPHLFSVHVDKTSRALSEDAKSPGTFQPMPP